MLAVKHRGNLQNLEAKHLKRTLGLLDARVVLPDSLKGSALVSRISSTHPRVSTQQKVRELLFPRRPNFRSWLTYAVAFLLIVGLFYGIEHQRLNSLGGELVLSPPNDDLPIMAEGGGQPGEFHAAGEGQYPLGVRVGGEVTDDVYSQPGVEVLDDNEVVSEGEINESIPSEPDVEYFVGTVAVGGAGMGTRLGEFGDFVLSYRPNDAADPDRLGYAPNVLLLLDADEVQIVSQHDIPYMTEITSFHLDGDVLVLVGSAGDIAHIQSIDYSDAQNPFTLLTLEQPGEIVAENYFDGILYLASHAPGLADDGSQIFVIEDSTEYGSVTLTLVNISESEVNRVVLSGVGSAVQLYRTEARVFYTVAAEGYESYYYDYDQWMARVDIVMGTMQMIFGGVSPAQ